jgi:hypothetical protein
LFSQKFVIHLVRAPVPEARPDAQVSKVILPGVHRPGTGTDGDQEICAPAPVYLLKYPSGITYIPRGLKSKGKSIVYQFFMFNYGN